MTPLDNLTDLIRDKCIVIDILSKQDSHKIYNKWLEVFAFKLKLANGKWKTGNYLWEYCFDKKSYPYFQGNKALIHYENQEPGTFYIFEEGGSPCYKCKSLTHPKFFDSYCDLYIVPEDFSWTAVVDHHGNNYFAYRPDKRAWGQMIDGIYYP